MKENRPHENLTGSCGNELNFDNHKDQTHCWEASVNTLAHRARFCMEGENITSKLIVHFVN